ncbi:MAG: flagellar motor switch protein FliG [Alphaproteobacteria bacterium TMED87]|nr:flagellar motor switch protein FliG [Rhodospirillaceae bacterium]OUV07920.1 MAG: flagellar motor switch protein FliG [Alphaproteobacteria bacterium TMED87]
MAQEELAAEVESDTSKLELLSGTQKCAILMLLLGEDEASEVLKSLSPREVQHLGNAMFSVQDVDQDTVNLVLDEFLAIIKAQTSIGLGASNYIRNVLTKALGDSKAESVLSRITPSESRKGMDILQWMDARSIAEMVMEEHPQIIALVLSYLDYAVAADVLTLLPLGVRANIVQRIATLETVAPEALEELERVMKQQFQVNTSLGASQVGGVVAAARIMNFTKTAMEAQIMKDLTKADKKLMQSIQDNMFTFDNLIMVDDKSLQTLLRSIDQDLLVLSMKGADDQLKDKLFGCMSQRAAANILDEMDALGPVRLADVQTAQKEIINVARKLSDAGTIVLAGRGGDDYV